MLRNSYNQLYVRTRDRLVCKWLDSLYDLSFIVNVSFLISLTDVYEKYPYSIIPSHTHSLYILLHNSYNISLAMLSRVTRSERYINGSNHVESCFILCFGFMKTSWGLFWHENTANNTPNTLHGKEENIVRLVAGWLRCLHNFRECNNFTIENMACLSTYVFNQPWTSKFYEISRWCIHWWCTTRKWPWIVYIITSGYYQYNKVISGFKWDY